MQLTNRLLILYLKRCKISRAKLEIQKLKDHSDVISWNDNGQLVLESSIVPNSNIGDLVNDVIRKRKGFNPEHSNTFTKALAKIYVPEDYVRNPDRIKILKHQDHHLLRSQLKHPLKFHREHPKAQQLLLLSAESG